jgi:hypothetical protein
MYLEQINCYLTVNRENGSACDWAKETSIAQRWNAYTISVERPVHHHRHEEEG